MKVNSYNNVIERVRDELNSLTDKINKLKAFINSESYLNTNEMQQELLIMQYESMLDYQSCLIARIKNLEKGN